MKQLQKKSLNHEITFRYIQESLEDANTLSSELIKLVNFESGNFFTLLPEGSNFERLYEFKEGIILPQNPIIQYESSPGHKSSYSIIPMIREELSILLRHKIVFEDLGCIFDNFIGKNAKANMPSSIACFYEKESYFFINKDIVLKDEASTKLIRACFDISDAFWHSLCILTKTEIEYDLSRELSLNSITEICQKAECVIIGAYDREGYIFWEKKDGFFP